MLTEGTCGSKNLDEKVRLQSEKREAWVREIREGLQGIAEGSSSAPSLVSSLAPSFPWRNECLGISCSLMVQVERENRSSERNSDKGKTEERTGWRGQSDSEREEGKRGSRLVGAAETCKELEEWRRL